MQTYRYACRKVGEQDMVVVILEGDHGPATATSHDRMRIQAAAQRAGIPGVVVLVWQTERGFRYIGPAAWAADLEALKWESIRSSTVGTLCA